MQRVREERFRWATSRSGSRTTPRDAGDLPVAGARTCGVIRMGISRRLDYQLGRKILNWSFEPPFDRLSVPTHRRAFDKVITKWRRPRVAMRGLREHDGSTDKGPPPLISGSPAVGVVYALQHDRVESRLSWDQYGFAVRRYIDSVFDENAGDFLTKS
jgi:hypothetical protein